ncbi:MAG TPA: hypothetical protein VJB68_06000 [Methylophilaceae bacterium]|nr:hypothetical protein [Methylophilaceae bacterium]
MRQTTTANYLIVCLKHQRKLFKIFCLLKTMVQKLGLPIALWNHNEVPIFQEAKRRLESRFSQQGVQIGAFYFEGGRAMLPENIEAAAKNSRTTQVIAAQRAFVDNYALNNITEMRQPVDATAPLYRTGPLNLDFHIGVTATDDKQLGDIASRQRELTEIIVRHLGDLADVAHGYGLGLVIESSPPVVVEPMRGVIRPHYFAFTTLQRLLEITHAVGKGNLGICFDAATLALVRTADAATPEMKARTARINGFTAWEDFTAAYGTFNAWVSASREYQLSNSAGIGAHLETHPEELARWGTMGTIEGGLTKEEMLHLLRVASEREVPTSLEVELDEKNLTYKETDELLEWLWPK